MFHVKVHCNPYLLFHIASSNPLVFSLCVFVHFSRIFAPIKNNNSNNNTRNTDDKLKGEQERETNMAKCIHTYTSVFTQSAFYIFCYIVIFGKKQCSI